jgi:uncharacterized protein
MPGAQITEQVDDTHYKGSVRSKVGPAVMTFNGDIDVLEAWTPASSKLQMLRQGRRQVRLVGLDGPDGLITSSPATPRTACWQRQAAVITVSGKLAQFGSRLLVPVSDAMLAQFADNFRRRRWPGAAAGCRDPPTGETPVARPRCRRGLQAGARRGRSIGPPSGGQGNQRLAIFWA